MSEQRLPDAGPGAPPRSNGELIFEAPWEARLFGMTMSLCDAAVIDWESFRAGLIAEIGDWDAHHVPGAPYRYYEHWLATLETLLADAGVCERAALETRTTAFADRPHGHDHDA